MHYCFFLCCPSYLCIVLSYLLSGYRIHAKLCPICLVIIKYMQGDGHQKVYKLTLYVFLQILRYLDDRCRVHKDTINFCRDVLQCKHVEWEPIERNNLSQPIRHVDLVVTIGGDGTLLRGSHFIDDTVPVLGVNSDPTQVEEVGVVTIVKILNM